MRKLKTEEVIKHLRGDIRDFRKEAEEDKHLIKRLRGSNMKKRKDRKVPGSYEGNEDEYAKEQREFRASQRNSKFREPSMGPERIRYPEDEPHSRSNVSKKEMRDAGSLAHMRTPKEDRKKLAASMVKKKMKKQGYNDRLDESLGERRGAESTKSQSYKDRRDESRGMRDRDDERRKMKRDPLSQSLTQRMVDETIEKRIREERERDNDYKDRRVGRRRR